MKKIVILGCENSHAGIFLNYIRDNKKYSDVEVLGVYSDEHDAMVELNKTYGVKIMSSFDEFAGQVDGVINVARNGANHLKFNKPYFANGVSMFLDKPITVSQEDALTLIELAKKNNVKLTGGSCLRFEKPVIDMRNDLINEVDGKTLGGLVRSPYDTKNNYGGYFFYSQHLVEVLTYIFGKFPKSVKAYVNGPVATVVFRYENYDVTGVYTDDGIDGYYCVRLAENGVKCSRYFTDDYGSGMDSFEKEFDEFYQLLSGAPQVADMKEFIAPVFILNAINRSINSGKEEIVEEYNV